MLGDRLDGERGLGNKEGVAVEEGRGNAII